MHRSDRVKRIGAQPVVVDHMFEGNDMFSRKSNGPHDQGNEPEQAPLRFTLEVRTYNAAAELYRDVISADLADGFLKITQEDRVTGYNSQDVMRTVSYEDS